MSMNLTFLPIHVTFQQILSGKVYWIKIYIYIKRLFIKPKVRLTAIVLIIFHIYIYIYRIEDAKRLLSYLADARQLKQTQLTMIYLTSL